MKKLYTGILILLIASATSCSKDRGNCYTCQVANTTTSYCGDISQYKPKDAQGNDLQVYCVPK